MSNIIVDQITGYTSANVVTAPTPPNGDSSSKIATTAFVVAAITSSWKSNGTSIYNSNSGNVGIGTNNPFGGSGTGNLEVSGNTKIDGSLLLPNAPLATNYGGTGLSSIGSSDKLLGVNPGSTGLEYKLLTSTSGTLAITNTTGQISIDLVNEGSEISVGLNGSVISTRPEINFITEGSLTANVEDNVGYDRADVTLMPIPTFRRNFLFS